MEGDPAPRDPQRAEFLGRTCPSQGLLPGQCMAAFGAAGGVTTPQGGCVACHRPWPCTACVAARGVCTYCAGGFLQGAQAAAQRGTPGAAAEQAPPPPPPPPPPPAFRCIQPRAEARASLLQSHEAGNQAERAAFERRLQRQREAAAATRAATPAVARVGGSPLPPHRTVAEAAADASWRRQNLEIRRRREQEEAAEAAQRAQEEAQRLARQDSQARARAANEARAAAEAAAAAQAVQQAWANSALFETAIGVLCSHPDNAPVLGAIIAKLLAILTAIEAAPDNSARRRLNVHSGSFPNAHGVLAALHAVGFAYDDESKRLLLADGYSRPALALARGRLQALALRGL